MTKPQNNASVAMLLQQAVQFHQAGRLDEADAIYDAVLKRDARNGDALNLKGLIALVKGHTETALDLLGRAVTVLPRHAGAHLNYGNALVSAGRHEDALTAYRKALQRDSKFADALLNFGALLHQLGRNNEAVAAFRTMAQAHPRDPRAHRGLGVSAGKAAIAASGETKDQALMAEARSSFQRASELAPHDGDVRFDFGNFLADHEDFEGARIQFEAALQIRPEWPEVLSNMGEALRKSERHADAIAAQRRALALRPGDPVILSHLANALHGAHNYDEAADIYRTLIAQNPEALLPYNNLGNVLNDAGHATEAIATFEDLLFRHPDDANAYASLAATFSEQGWQASAYVLHRKARASNPRNAELQFRDGCLTLSLGRFREGWPAYEGRFFCAEDPVRKRPEPPPDWQGENLDGKKILLWTEQGIGDEIIYASMISEVVRMGAHCLIACSKRMVPIFTRAFPTCDVVGYKSSAAEILRAEGFDYQSAIASLGRYLRPHFQSFPREPSYLRADPALVSELRTRYEQMAAGRRIVGISWRSKATKGAPKSLTLSDFAPLFQVPGVMFVNLQYGDCEAERAAVQDQCGIAIVQDANVDPLADLDAFFAQVAAMDLVITTSNSTAHVAGAQGIPTWVILPYARGLLWYWFFERADSPWYPSLQLMRQTNTKHENSSLSAVVRHQVHPRLVQWAAQSRG